MYIVYQNLEEMLTHYKIKMQIDKDFYGMAIRYLRGGDVREHGLLLYMLVQYYRPKYIYEAGTARGFSAVMMAKAMEEGRINGEIFTYDTTSCSQPRAWYAPTKCTDEDPAKDKLITREELLAPFSKELLQRIHFSNEDVLVGLQQSDIPFDMAFLDVDCNDVSLLSSIIKELYKRNKNVIVSLDGYNSTGWTHKVRHDRIADFVSKSIFKEIIQDRNRDLLVHRDFVAKYMRCYGTYLVVEKYRKYVSKIEVVSLPDRGRDDYGVAILYFENK